MIKYIGYATRGPGEATATVGPYDTPKEVVDNARDEGFDGVFVVQVEGEWHGNLDNTGN